MREVDDRAMPEADDALTCGLALAGPTGLRARSIARLGCEAASLAGIGESLRFAQPAGLGHRGMCEASVMSIVTRYHMYPQATCL